ncbi:MAG: acetoin dehydrogenase dihydrolipoyllysine-residue acetyltransferase subunit [Robiginitomaculum sp.]|nr:acetoin dehydrogenase dihydrolipoyllysine-residue acetyltransferase subunit [Robiginitomaculum sp.]
MTNTITSILLPKWGMDMAEGKIGDWLVSEGEQVTPGAEVLEIETEKVTNVLETTVSGTLRRQLANPGDTYPVGALLGVIADASVSDDDLSDFIASYEASAPVLSDIDSPTLELIDDMAEVDGQQLHYISAGDGDKTVVLIHGFGGSLSSWGGLPMALASSYRVISVELPGHGTSSKQIKGGGTRDFADLLFTFLDSLGVNEIHLVGHSLGGAIAAQMASSAPKRVNSLSLISNYGLGTKVDSNYIEEFVGAARRKAVKLALKKLFVDGALVNSDMIESVLRLKRIEGVELALRTIADKIGGEQPREASVLLPPVPTQVIVGKKDNIINFDGGLLAELDNFSLIEGAAHMPQLEKAAQTEALIKEFLEQHHEYETLQA